MKIYIYSLFLLVFVVGFQGFSQNTITFPINNNPLPTETLRILMIGNSFTDDVTEYIGEIVQNSGIDQETCCVYRVTQGGSQLQTWSDMYINNTHVALEKKAGLLSMNITEGAMSEILHQNWDVISLQQLSNYSNDISTFSPYLEDLISYIKTDCTNEKVALCWHLTWSYWEGHTAAGPKEYVGWESIVSTVKDMNRTYGIDIIIPSGTAIQNARATELNTEKSLTRDGYHMDYGIGRYIIACTLYESLFQPVYGTSISNISWYPTSISETMGMLARNCATNAVLHWDEAEIHNHDYALDSWIWADDKESASVKFICQNDANHVETVDAVVTTDTTHATCTTDGKIVYTAKAEFEGNEYADTKEVTLEKLGHDYALDSWSWAEDKESASVKFVCENDVNHVETVDAVVTTDTTHATCTTDGKIVYTANAEFEGNKYTDTKEVTLPAINHKYALNEWLWAEDKESARVKFVCENDANHVETVESVVTTDTTHATCTTDGTIVYTANAEFEGQKYSDTKEVTLPAINHKYALNEWQWAEDKESARVEFICENDANHIETVDAVVTTDTTHATCTTDGKIVYTANAEFEGQTYTDTKEVSLPAINHKYEFDLWQWAEDMESASVKFVCENDANHVETVESVVTTDTTHATCTTDGKIVYTANAEFEGNKYTDTKEVTLEKIGHDYASQGWEWRDDWSGAKIRFVCKNDANHIDSVEVTTVVDTITNAGIANPEVLFVVETEFAGQTYSDLKTKTLSAQFSIHYNEAGNDIDGDGVSDEFLDAFTKELYGATEYYWDRFWSPTTGDFFLITMTGVANYSGTLQFELVDTLRTVSLGEKSSLIQVVAGEEFTAKVPLTVTVMRDSLGNKLKYTVLEFICTPEETSSSPLFTNNACEFDFSDFEIMYESAGTEIYDNPHSLILVGQDKYEYLYEGVFSTKLAAPTKCSVLNLSITVIPDIPLDFFAFSLVDSETMRSIIGEPYIKLENSTMYVAKKEYTYEFTIPIDSVVATSPKLLLHTESPYERQRAIYYIKSLNLSYSKIHTEEIIPELAPTCEEPGHSEGVRCSVCGTILTEPTEYPALGHAYVSQGWHWTDDFSEASVDFVCANDATHTHTEHAQISSKTVPATCTAEGAIIYMAKVMLGEATYQDTKISVLEIVPHTEMIVEGVQPTCTETGLSDGVQCAVCGAVLVEQSELPALGHSLRHEAYIAPTVDDEGVEEHWYCTVCHSIFDSEAATHEISNADVIIPKLDPTGVPSLLSHVNVYPQKKHIVVEQAEGELLRIFDVNGHCVVSERISTQFASYSISVAGAYVVAVGATVVSVVVQ